MHTDVANDPTPEDVAELRRKLAAALVSIPEVTIASAYPVYPEAMREFTRYLSRSPWHRTDCTVDMKENLRPKIESLDLGQVRSYLTFLTRVDRFSPGGLLGELEEGYATRVVDRAAALLGE